MITINNCGKFIVPKGECFIGYTGDDLNVTKEIFVEGITDLSLVYRMYLKFDDGTCNYFLLESEVQQEGTMLVWTITNDQIYKGGVVQVQIKASNSSGEVFHSSITTMLVQTSIEFTDYFRTKENSEFLQHEEYLNNLYQLQEQANHTATETLEKAESKLEELNSMEMDTAPAEGSSVPVTSGGVYTALSTKLNYMDVGPVIYLSELNAFTDLSTIYDVSVSNALLGNDDGNYSPCKIFNYISTQILLHNDGRIFTRDLVRSTGFEKVGFTISEILSFISESGSGPLDPSSSMASSCYYIYHTVGNVVTLKFTAIVQLPSDTATSADFTGLPYIPDTNSMATLVFSDSNCPYIVQINNGTLTFRPVSSGSFSYTPPADKDVIVAEFTYVF